MRNRLILALLAGVCLPALAQPLPADTAGRLEPGMMLEALPQPGAPFAEPVQALPPIRLPDLPDVVVAIPDAGDGLVTASIARAAAPAHDGFALPALPEPGEGAEAILNDSAAPTIPAMPTGAVVMRAPEPRPAAADSALPDLPQPGDPNALIAMLAPSAATKVPSAAPLASPEPGQATPVAPLSLAPERLELAFATLARLYAFPAGQAQSAREFYLNGQDQPLWTGQDGLNARGSALLATVAAAESHGLAPARFRKLQEALATAGDAETREAGVTLLAIAYARDARGARLNPLSVARLITAATTMPETANLLAALVAASAPGTVLEGYNPRHPGYAALRAKLAGITTPDQIALASPKLTFGPVLTQGMTDLRVPLLREVLGLPPVESALFDADLAGAVRGFQRQQGLRVTGRLDRATTAALGGVNEDIVPSQDPRADIIANMERWRWLPVDIGDDHILVNIPDFSLAMVRDGAVALRTRVIIGKPETQTPVFSDKMQFLVVNPSWNVPPSIALKEYLPLLQKNPQALSARGLQVISNGRVVDPASVDWSKVGRSVAIRQPPGERNALGHVKFMFPNQHAVYLHDTPNRSLFANERRAYSHGCVRVQDPFRLAEAIMGTDWSERRLRALVGGGERHITLPAEMPVHLAYFTSFVDDAGTLQTREDLYGHNRRVKALLGL